MKLKLTVLSLLLTQSVVNTNAQDWQLVWQDEFTNGIGPDWVFETGNGRDGWGNNEFQYYRRENATVQNGQLVITAKRQNFGGYRYTSARMKTEGRKFWTYGKIEARIKMPSFTGSWPAFWTLGQNIGQVGWPACGEIDIMEHINTAPDIFATIHWSDQNGNYATYSGGTRINVTDYHVYGIEWDANAIKWYVDGRLFHQASIANGVNGTSEFSADQFLLLNMAIGGRYPGFVVDDNAFPASMYVDWVRVYQDGGAPNTTGLVTTFRDCDYGGKSSGIKAVGDYTLSQLEELNIINNDISSLKITQGYQAILYENDNFQGQSTVINSDNACLNTFWNDKVSSIKVRPAGATNLEGTYYIQNRKSGLMLDVAGGEAAVADGDNVHQWPLTNTKNQQFSFEHLGDGAYKITAVHSGKVLDVEAINPNNDANIHQWTYFGSDNQKFIVVPADGEHYKLVAQHSGRIVEIFNCATNQQANVQQYDNNNQDCGQWKFIPVNSTVNSIDEENSLYKINMFPNPVVDNLTIEIGESNLSGSSVEITNNVGKVVYNKIIYGSKLELSDLEKGFYILKIIDKDRNQYVRTFVKK